MGIISAGQRVAEDTPEKLKAEVGSSRLEVTIHDEQERGRAREVLARRGELVDPEPGVSFCLKLPKGEARLAPFVLELDQAGVTVDRIDLVEPTLDDVFLLKTGTHIPGDDQ